MFKFLSSFFLIILSFATPTGSVGQEYFSPLPTSPGSLRSQCFQVAPGRYSCTAFSQEPHSIYSLPPGNSGLPVPLQLPIAFELRITPLTFPSPGPQGALPLSTLPNFQAVQGVSELSTYFPSGTRSTFPGIPLLQQPLGW